MSAVGAAPHWHHAVSLSLIIIFLYNLDHYLDSHKALASQIARLGERRKLHIQYAKFLLPVSLAAATIAAVIILILFPIGLIVSGIIFCGAILLYYIAIHFFKIKLPKELIAAIGYALGCWLPALYYGFVGKVFHLGYLLILLHSLAALANLISYSIIDSEEDLQIGMNSTLSIERLHSFRAIIPALAIALSIILVIAGLSINFVLAILIVTALQIFLPFFTNNSTTARLYGENIFTIIFVFLIFN